MNSYSYAVYIMEFIQNCYINKKIYVNIMEFKRMKTSPMQSPNRPGNALIQPLISISKASTPVRTRVVNAPVPLNSTPVNINKVQKNTQNNNKENDPYNIRYKKQNETQLKFIKNEYHEYQQSYKSSNQYESQRRINLNPVMALNKKLKEGPNLNNFEKSPTRFLRHGSNTLLYGEEQKKQYQTLNNSKQSGNLQSSNSFKSLLENKGNRAGSMAFGNIKKSEQNSLANSNNFGKGLFTGIGERKLLQSKAQGVQLKSPRVSDISCMNNHGQKGKYKVSKKQNEMEQNELLVYCSRCAIALVQQGFSVEELTAQDVSFLQNQIQPSFPQSENPQLLKLKKDLNGRRDQMKANKDKFLNSFQKELDEVDCFYNSVISMIEEQRVKDREAILSIRNNLKIEPQKYEQQLEEAINRLEAYTNKHKNILINKGIPEIKQGQSVLQKNIEYTCIGKIIEGQIQDYFDNFSHIFETKMKLKIVGNSKVSRQCPLRFSFDKVNENRGLKNNLMNFDRVNEESEEQIEEVDEEIQELKGNEKKAFRSLFPDEQSDNSDSQENKIIKSPTFKQF